MSLRDRYEAISWGDRAVELRVSDHSAFQTPNLGIGVLAQRLRFELDRAGVEVDCSTSETAVLLFARPGERLLKTHVLLALDGLDEQAAQSVAPRKHRIGIRYDGADLEWVASFAGLSVSEVVSRHCAVVYTVSFVGFAPGFGYLTGGDPALVVPRRESPRAKVLAGSLGIAGPYSAVYPRDSPGGWRLLGTCEEVMFDPSHDEPSRLAAGDLVTFFRLGGL